MRKNVQIVFSVFHYAIRNAETNFAFQSDLRERNRTDLNSDKVKATSVTLSPNATTINQFF